MVQQTLQRLDGVATATVNFPEKQAEIVVDDTFVLMPTRIKKAVEDVGFHAGDIDVLGSGQIISRQGNFVIRFEDQRDVVLVSNQLTEKLATDQQPVHILLRVVEETGDAFKLRVIKVAKEK